MGKPRDAGNAGAQSSKTNLELLNEIDDMLDGPPDADFDLDAVRENLKTLQERAPVEQIRSRQESWDELMASISTEKQTTEETAEPKKNHKVKVWRILEVAVILILVLAVSASAFNFNPFQPLLQVVSDIVHSFSNPSGTLELPEDADVEYHSLREALDANGAADAQCLTWIPKEFSFDLAEVKTANSITKYIGYYSSEFKDILVNVTEFKGEDYVASMERNMEIAFETIVIGGREYQWTNNLDMIIVWWNDGKYDYELHGELTKKEVETIIQSFK